MEIASGKGHSCRRFALAKRGAGVPFTEHCLRESTSTDLSSIRSEYYASGMTKFPRPPRSLERVYAHDPLYFITCCTYRRRPLLANHPVHAAFVEFGQRGQKDLGVAVGRYVILPNHLHFSLRFLPVLIFEVGLARLNALVAKPSNATIRVNQSGGAAFSVNICEVQK